jgi:hypothetical protein
MAASEIALRQELEVVNGTVAALATFAKNPLAEARLLVARQTKRRLQVEISQRKPDQERVVILRDRVIPGKEKAIAELQSRIVNLRASLETEHSELAECQLELRSKEERIAALLLEQEAADVEVDNLESASQHSFRPVRPEDQVKQDLISKFNAQFQGMSVAHISQLSMFCHAASTGAMGPQVAAQMFGTGPGLLPASLGSPTGLPFSTPTANIGLGHLQASAGAPASPAELSPRLSTSAAAAAVTPVAAATVGSGGSPAAPVLAGRSEEQIAADFSLGDTQAAYDPYGYPQPTSPVEVPAGPEAWEDDDDMASASSGDDGVAPTDDKVSAVLGKGGKGPAPFRARTASSVRKRVDKDATAPMRTRSHTAAKSQQST